MEFFKKLVKRAIVNKLATIGSRCGAIFVAMAPAARLHPLLSLRVLYPTLSQRSSFPADFLQLSRLSSTGRLFSSVNVSKPPLTPALAQAKRGFSPKDDEVASPDDLRYEAPLRIVEYPDPILRAKSKRIESFDDNLKKLVGEMFDIMYKTDGIGLSAPQVGINVQLMVFNPVGERGEGEEIVLVNPRVNKYSKKMVLFNEGCLSFPGIYADVERPETVKVDARDMNGARFSVSLSGLPARIFQHEFDHLKVFYFTFDSILFGKEVKHAFRIGSKWMDCEISKSHSTCELEALHRNSYLLDCTKMADCEIG